MKMEEIILTYGCALIILWILLYIVVMLVNSIVSYAHERRTEMGIQQPRKNDAQTEFRGFSRQLVPLDYFGNTTHLQDNTNYQRSRLEDLWNDTHEGQYISSRTNQPSKLALPSEFRYHGSLPSLCESGFKPTNTSTPRHKKEIDTYSTSRRGYTPFLEACWDCNVSEIVALIEQGADPLQTTQSGETGLILCIYRMAKGKRIWNPDCLNLLVENGCPVDAETEEHNTALHLAVKNEHLPSIMWLLNQGANIGVANDAGWRPTTIANALGRKDIAMLLWRRFLKLKVPQSPSQSNTVKRCLFQDDE